MTAATVAQLLVAIGADLSGLNAGMSKANKLVDSFGMSVAGVGKSMAVFAAGATIAGITAVGAGLAASTASAAGFEKQMSAIKAVSGATGAEMQQLSGLALKLGADTSFSASEAAQGIEELIKAGVSVADIMGGGASAALSLAAAGAVSVKDAAELTSNALNAFGLAGTDAARVADTIAGAANSSAIDVGEFKFALSSVGAVAHAVGFNFEDTAAAIAVMGQAGIKGSDAGTSLKTMFLNLQPTTKAQIGLFKELGLTTADGANRFFDAAGNVKSMSEVAGILQTSLGGLTKQQQLMALETIFGSDAIRAATVFVDQGRAGFDKMSESMKKVTAEAVAQERLNNLAGAWEQFTGTLETAGIALGTDLLPALKEVVQWGSEGLGSMIPTIKEVGTQLGGSLSDGVKTAKDLFRQLRDAYQTTKQVFDEGWEPSAEIEPLALAAGNAATELKKLAEWAGKVSEAAGRMGAWENFASGLATTAVETETISENMRGLSEALGRLNAAVGDSSTKITVLGAAVKVVGVAFELLTLNVSQIIDTTIQAARSATNMATVFMSVGRQLYAIATGDMPMYEQALRDGSAAMADLIISNRDFADRTVERAKQGFRAISGSAQTEMPAMAAAVEASTAQVSDAIDTSMMEAVATTNDMMVQMGVSVDQGMTGVAASVGDGMTQATAAIQAEAPAMAAAAGEGAAGAVAAVESQQGPASAAGSGVGDSIGSGMESGILGWVGRIAAAASDLVSRAIGAARAEADAHSPSRKTEQLGKDLAEGLDVGLSKANIGAELVAKIRDMIDAARAYVPTAREIARVEGEIKGIRDAAQTDALFRAEDMIALESELLRLKRDQVGEERRLLPIRRDLADAEREVGRLAAGSLQDRSALLENDAERKQIRLQTLDLERQLVGLDRDSKRAESIQKQIDRLRDQDQLLGIEAERITTTNQLAATAERRRVLGLGEILASEERNINAIVREIATLGAEKSVFEANEAIIKNATENEIAYRNRLIAVFTAEGKPLADRIAAGMALVDQLEAEGAISKELADKIREQAKQSGIATTATQNLGTAAHNATPQMDAAAKKAEEMAKQAAAIARQAGNASGEVSDLAKSLGKLPSWFTATGSKGKDMLGFGGGRADGGPISAGVSYLVGERGPEMIVPRYDATVVPLIPGGGNAVNITVHVTVQGSTLVSRRDIEDAVVVGIKAAVDHGQLNRTVLAPGNYR